MGRNKINLIGQKIGRLTVLKEIKKRNTRGNILYLCKCECGIKKKIIGSNLRAKLTKSCGCLHKDSISTHGFTNSINFNIYQGIKYRCYNENEKSYSNYGGRGIKMCDRWLDAENGFLKFIEDMGERPSLQHSVDRIDNDKGYSPENCRWATSKEQGRNRGNNSKFTYKSLTKCESEWRELYPMAHSTFLNRIKRGWSIDKTLETPVRKLNKSK